MKERTPEWRCTWSTKAQGERLMIWTTKLKNWSVRTFSCSIPEISIELSRREEEEEEELVERKGETEFMI